MKKTSLLILLLIILPMLFACEKENTEDTDVTVGFEMEAQVVALGEKMEVNVTKSEYSSGPFWIIISDKTEFLDAKGEKIKREDIGVGDTVTIAYNGQVMMSYPPQVVALSVKRK